MSIKNIYNGLPSQAREFLTPILRKVIIYNPFFLSTYRNLEKIELMNTTERKCLEEKKLKEMLIYAYDNVEYYKKSFDSVEFNPRLDQVDKLGNLPIINKHIVNANHSSFLSRQRISTYTTYTGGTTGKPSKIILDSNSIFKERAFVYHTWSELGFDYKKSRIVTFRGVNYENDEIKKSNPIYNELLLSPFNLSRKRILEYVEVIREFKPEFISGYPSIIKLFCKLHNELSPSERISVKGVFLISENMNPNEIAFIKKSLQCRVKTFYGHSERAVFGEEIESGVYRFNGFYGFVELIDNGDGYYRIITTGLINKKLPLIRYDTGDLALQCDDGYRIAGRWNEDDVLLGRNGERISLAAINFHDKEFEILDSYQFVQKIIGTVDCYINGKDIDESIVHKIKILLEQKIADSIQVIFHVNEGVKLTPRGKYKMLISEISSQEEL